MFAEAVIGSAFTFQVYTDPSLIAPTIDVFQFSQTGVKQYLVTAQLMDPVTPAEVGRFTYVYTIPTALTDGDTLYAEVWDAGSRQAALELTAISSNRGLGASVGMTASFF